MTAVQPKSPGVMPELLVFSGIYLRNATERSPRLVDFLLDLFSACRSQVPQRAGAIHMTEPFLDCSKIHTGLEMHGGEGRSEFMEPPVIGIQSGPLRDCLAAVKKVELRVAGTGSKE